ncbi:folate family ECF transporter S component [Peptoniphilus sp. GNH]|nr:hypothetical protein HMPREF3189_00279 [Clostridiales bacterium KA00134]UHR03330.1 folate family ECF transporter S component [Peptoniphilus sp. GNH]
MKNTKKLTLLALFVALHIVVNSFITIPTPMNRFGPSFLVTALAAALFGPWGGACVGGLSDFIRANIMPQGGSYFPGFTLTSALAGFIYGIFFYKKEIKPWRMIAGSLLVDLVPNFLINSFWISKLRGITYFQSLMTRMIPSAFQAQLKLIVMLLIFGKLVELARKKIIND